jgi:hypothetical protein
MESANVLIGYWNRSVMLLDRYHYYSFTTT